METLRKPKIKKWLNVGTLIKFTLNKFTKLMLAQCASKNHPFLTLLTNFLPFLHVDSIHWIHAHANFDMRIYPHISRICTCFTCWRMLPPQCTYYVHIPIFMGFSLLKLRALETVVQRWTIGRQDALPPPPFSVYFLLCNVYFAHRCTTGVKPGFGIVR